MKRLTINKISISINCKMNKMQWALLIILLIGLSVLSPALLANNFQDKKPIRTKLSLTCTQLPNHQISVQAKLRAKPEKRYVPVADATISIYNLTDTTEVFLGKGTSDKNGLIELMVDAKDQLSINEEGYYGVMATYEGDDNYKSSDDDLLFKSAILEMQTEVIDSVKTITIKIYEDNEVASPLEEVEVILEVPRMFSNLPIATEYTDEDGIVSIEFPNDLPGGENGELIIVAMVEDTDDHASLKNQLENNWGIPFSALQSNDTRTLWSPNAPAWMVFTFALLMVLVWGHFLVIIYKLISIRREGNLMAEENS